MDPGQELAELAKVLNLPGPPQRIEGFDISNISDTFAVASMVSFRNGKPDRSNYRRFKMKTVTGQDDFACMAETVRRRYSRLLKEAEAAPGEVGKDPLPPAGQVPPPRPVTASPALPDLFLVDGGIGQQRKAALLKKFGSVQRLRLATVEQISQVPGFGGKAAAELKAFLQARTISGTDPGPDSGPDPGIKDVGTNNG